MLNIMKKIYKTLSTECRTRGFYFTVHNECIPFDWSISSLFL